jgi:HlyD family secretion protein
VPDVVPAVVPDVAPKKDEPTQAKATPKSPSRRWLWISLAIVAVVAIIFAVWWFTRPPAVAAVKAQWSPLVRTLQFSARVATTSRVDIGSTITGRVTQVMVREGDLVKKDVALIQLESEELKAALQQAKAAENQANERLAGLRSTGRSVVDAAVAQADSVVVKAQSELRRTQELAAKGFLSQTRLDEAVSATTVAQALRQSARAQSAANRGTELAQAISQARLAQVVLNAPADARILTRLVEPGQIVQPGKALFSLALIGPTLLVAQVDERYLEQLRNGQLASVVADAFPTSRFTAIVQLIAPIVDAQRGAVQVKLSLIKQAPEFLREDMTLSVEVETASRDRALVVPVEALRGDESSSSATVLVVRGGRAEQRTVRVGIRTLKSAEVVEGLAEGDIVLKGSTLKSGSRVRALMPTND